MVPEVGFEPTLMRGRNRRDYPVADSGVLKSFIVDGFEPSACAIGRFFGIFYHIVRH